MTALKLDHSKPPYYYISSVGNTNLYYLVSWKKKTDSSAKIEDNFTIKYFGWNLSLTTHWRDNLPDI